MRHFRFSSAVLLFALLISAPSLAPPSEAQAPRKKPARAATPKPTPSAKPPQTKYKGVFEPVSYSEDLNLTSVFFVDEDTGWASGAAGTIIHTSDGGETWTPQMGGDPVGSEAQIDHLLFLDSNTGWAVGGTENTVQRKLLGTRDGQTWRQVGTVGTPLGSYSDYIFTSPSNGLFIEGSTASVSAIYQTRDGGRNWKPVLPQCKAKVRISGLNKDLTCRLKDFFFLTPTLGWAAGAGSAGTVFVLRTQDGGSTWEYIFVEPNLGHPDEPHFTQQIFFTDENHGVLALPRADKLLTTSDGGKTWEVAPVAAVESDIRFADPEVGWMYGEGKLLFTTNGGKSFLSRALRFPASVTGFSLPSRQRGYVVGNSGMVFRYRAVETSYQNPESIPAPLMPGVGETLEPELAEIRENAEALQTKLETAAAADGGAAAGTESAAAEGEAEAEAESETEASFEEVAAAEPSEFIEDCCAAELQELQSDMGSFLAEVPVVTTKYRSLNMIFAGLQMVTSLIDQANSMRSAFSSLKDATDAQSALAAVQEILANVDSTKQMVAAGFASPPPLPEEDLGGAAGALAGDAAADAAQEIIAPDEENAPAPEQPGAEAAASAIDKAKEKVKKKLKLPRPW